MSHPFRFVYAAIVAALLGFAGMVPAGAASIPTDAALSFDQASTKADSVQWRGNRNRARPAYGARPAFRARPVYSARPVYRSRPVYHGRPVYRSRPVYRRHGYRPAYYYNPYPVYPVYTTCVKRKRLVWTRYGYVRRWVRICR